MRGKQSFKKVFGTLEGKKDIENKGKGFPIGLLSICC